MTTRERADETITADIEAVLAGSRALVGVAAASLGDALETVTLPQLRALMIVATHGPLNVASLAEHLGVHPSNATRTVDRLVSVGLLRRSDSPVDRRHLRLDLTNSGREFIDGIVARRRAAIARILQRMPVGHRRELGRAIAHFAAAAGEPPPSELWTLGWVG